MNRKRFILGLGAVLLCTSLIAYGADPPSPTASASATEAISPRIRAAKTPEITAAKTPETTAARTPETGAAMPEAAAKTDLKTARNQGPARNTPLMADSLKKNATSAMLGGPRDAPPNDECENAELVTGPYPVTVCGTNMGATIDCPGVLDWEAVWYEVELPYELNNLVIDYCAGEIDMGGNYVGQVYFNDCTCGESVTGRHQWFDCGDGNRSPRIWWNAVPGPTTVLFPAYIRPPHDFCITFNVTEAVPPPNDICENAEVVTSPYPTTVCGTNVLATTDCPGVLDWEAVWYKVELPYERNKLVADYCPGEISMVTDVPGITYCYNDCTCGEPVIGRAQWFDCGYSDFWAPRVWWDELPGPTTVLIPVYIQDPHDFCIEFNVTEVVPPANDTCENAELVTSPYPTMVCGTTVGATIDCPGVLDWEAVWYEVELPYAVNTVETDYCPGKIDMRSESIGVVYVDDCTCEAPVIGNYAWYDCGNNSYNPKVWWRDVPGPGSIFIPVWIDQAHDFCIEFNVRDGACELDCPPGGVAEGEACGEDTNGGCNMATPAFEPLTCGETVCGTCWADYGRDTDWYEITIDEPMIMTFTVEAQFITGVSTGLMEPLTPGVVGCDQLVGLVNPWETAGDCEEVSVVYSAVPGTYWWFAAPNDWINMPCGGRNDYIATMTCEPWDAYGACCDEELGDCTDNVRFQDCAEPKRWTVDTLCADLSPPCGGCPENMLEIEIRTDSNPSETIWRITDHDDPTTVICSGGPYPHEDTYTTFLEYCCIGADDCVDFTIYDQGGDGQSWYDGGYAVHIDGVEVCSTLDTSWSGVKQSCNNLGGGCELGRCCYDPYPNCADTTLLDCLTIYDGLWSEGLNCTDDPCQDPNAPDFEVVAPHTSPLRSTCNTLDRCHPADQYYDTPEHVYRVTIPYDGVWCFNTCLTGSNIATWLSVGTSMCSEDIGWSAYACNGYFSEVVAYLTAGDYFVDVEGYRQCCTYVLDIHEVPVCDVECPEGSAPESEPCGDRTNNGCWMYPPAFEPIACNQTICGTIWATSSEYDGDWFEFVAPADDTMTWSLRSNVSGEVGVAEQYVPGQPGCDNLTGAFTPSATTSDCEETSVSFPVTAGGTYYLYVGHGHMGDQSSSYTSPCGTTNDYVATLTGSNCICGDLDNDNDVDRDDYAIFLEAFGGPVDGNPPQDAACDFDDSGAVGMADYAAWLNCYRAYIGDRLATPPVRPNSSGLHSSVPRRVRPALPATTDNTAEKRTDKFRTNKAPLP